MPVSQTIAYRTRPRVRMTAAIAGPKEGLGPYGSDFDEVLSDDLLGRDTFEQAESELSRRTVMKCLEKAGMTEKALETLLCGDLLNQIAASGFAARQLAVPFLGLYGACSTAIEALLLGGVLIDSGYRKNAICAASSHWCAAERQFRFPLELGNQRPPSAQWTATAAGAMLLDGDPKRALARLTHATIGKVIDYQITDANHMGAAMAPAVADTIGAHMRDLSRSYKDYDLIVTGDLGMIGRDILLALLKERGMEIPGEKLVDCGATLYDKSQDVHAGGSGCGCIASVLSAHFIKLLEGGQMRRVLALGSGAMLSPTTTQQGESIPSISYAAALEAED